MSQANEGRAPTQSARGETSDSAGGPRPGESAKEHADRQAQQNPVCLIDRIVLAMLGKKGAGKYTSK